MIHSYSTVYAIGHAATAELFLDTVLVEEKVDGSQFSFGVIDGVLQCRSKGQQLVVDAPEKMFATGVQTALTLAPSLRPGWVYRCEYLEKPKHNTLVYGRTPVMNVILFDVQANGDQVYLSPEEKFQEAARLDLECVPVLYEGRVESVEALKALLERESCLGGTTIEGVVVKNYARFGVDKKALMGKYVSERFKEVHTGDWRERNPSSGDVVQRLITRYRTDARWQKAVQHLREVGTLEGSPRDIGALIREVPADVKRECEEEIKAALFGWAWPQVQRAITAGLPEWYKEQLAAAAFPPEV